MKKILILPCELANLKIQVWLLKKVSENKAGLFAHSSLFEHDPKPEKLDDLRHIPCTLKPSDANGGVWILQHDQQQQKFSIQVNGRFKVNSIVD